MYAVEIETDVKEKFIEIPEFDKFKDQHIKVIFMKTESSNKNVKKIPSSTNTSSKTSDIESFLKSINIDIRDYKLDRDDANAR